MNCQNCGSKIKQGEFFCRMCGTKIENGQQIEMLQQNNNMNGNMYNNDALINAYIGKNVDKLRDGSFSWNILFLGNIYVLYRKMWLLWLLWFVATLIIGMFLSSLSSVLTIAVNIIVATQFKKWYLKHVEEKVEKIKSKNPGASYEQLLAICTKKGGTAIWPIIIWAILCVIIIVVVIFFYLMVWSSIKNQITENTNNYYNDNTANSNINNNNNNINNSNTNKNGYVYVDVPSVLEASSYNDDTYRYYSLINSTDYCNLTMSMHITSSLSAKDYLESVVTYSLSDSVSSIITKEINGETWYYMSVQNSYSTSYYYAKMYNGKVYFIQYRIVDDSGVCSKAYSDTINSMRFVLE